MIRVFNPRLLFLILGNIKILHIVLTEQCSCGIIRKHGVIQCKRIFKRTESFVKVGVRKWLRLRLKSKPRARVRFVSAVAKAMCRERGAIVPLLAFYNAKIRQKSPQVVKHVVKGENGLVQPRKQGRTSPLCLLRKYEILRGFARK